MNSLSLDQFAPETVAIKKLASEPAELPHDFQILTLSLLILHVDSELVLLFLVKELLKSLVLHDGLSQPLFVLGYDPTLALDTLEWLVTYWPL